MEDGDPIAIISWSPMQPQGKNGPRKVWYTAISKSSHGVQVQSPGHPPDAQATSQGVQCGMVPGAIDEALGWMGSIESWLQMLPHGALTDEVDWHSGHLTDEVAALIRNKGHVLIFHRGGCAPYAQVNDAHLHALLSRISLHVENDWALKERERLTDMGLKKRVKTMAKTRGFRVRAFHKVRPGYQHFRKVRVDDLGPVGDKPNRGMCIKPGHQGKKTCERCRIHKPRCATQCWMREVDWAHACRSRVGMCVDTFHDLHLPTDSCMISYMNNHLKRAHYDMDICDILALHDVGNIVWDYTDSTMPLALSPSTKEAIDVHGSSSPPGNRFYQLRLFSGQQVAVDPQWTGCRFDPLPFGWILSGHLQIGRMPYRLIHSHHVYYVDQVTGKLMYENNLPVRSKGKIISMLMPDGDSVADMATQVCEAAVDDAVTVLLGADDDDDSDRSDG